jgi:aspartate/methionine/tyrosine aminotransferase
VFASRTNWQRQPNQLSQLIEEKRQSLSPILDLTRSNPTECGFRYPEERILSALSHPAALQYHPDPRGALPARETIAKYYHDHGQPVDASRIVLTASTSEGYAFVFRLLCESGDDVLVPVPSYPLFEYLAQLSDVTLRPYQLRYDGEWHVDLRSVEGALTSSTKAIIIINPHNPTGMFLKKPELASLSALAATRNCALIVDEVFADYGFAGAMPKIARTAAHENALTFTLNGISKLAGLPQLKLGWIAVSGPRALREEALARLEILADTYLSVNTPAQVALPELLASGEIVREAIKTRTINNYHFVRESIRDTSVCTALQSEGGWYGILQVPRTRSGDEWAIALLKNTGVYVHPGYFFEFQEDNVLVLSLLTPADDFREGVRRLVSYVEGSG